MNITRAGWIQLASLWGAAILVLVTAGWLLLLAGFFGTPLLAAPVPFVLVGTAYGLGSATQSASRLTEDHGTRLLWACVVGLVGLAGTFFVFAAFDAAGIEHLPWVAIILCGLPYPLVAGILATPWAFRAGAAVLTVALIVLGVWLPASRDKPASTGERFAEMVHDVFIPHKTKQLKLDFRD
ncbi:hypothetical protein SAMN05421504_114104 [Amycolatopsis xylanica]|uniref:Uncharacterized protein n=1 Tax=Amycolatopsis xylanica TaxID=589385 RepID=A0A1H3SLY8_9PSEU|nr:hypothetical protein [Amycolatopsis xylanica]SDZ38710.1 hypothetical protein SAMN05421504_114104 [Amycolatopsis xylanica]